MRVKFKILLSLAGLMLMNTQRIQGQVDTMSLNQHGFREKLIISDGSNKNKTHKIRCLVIYKGSGAQRSYADSIYGLKNSFYFNSDTFQIYILRLYKPAMLPEEAGSCPPPSKLEFFGKSINHSNLSEGIWFLIDTPVSKIRPSFWESIKAKDENIIFHESTMGPGLMEIAGFHDFYKFITRPYLRNDILLRYFLSEISPIKEYLDELNAKYRQLNSEIELNRKKLVSASLNFGKLSVGKNVKKEFTNHEITNFATQGFLLNLEKYTPLKKVTLLRELRLGYAYIFGELTQKSEVLTESLGYYYMGPTRYERYVYAKNMSEGFKISFVSFGIGLGVCKEFQNKNISLYAGASLLNNVYSNYNVKAESISFGGLFREYNPVDTMFSGYGDLYLNKKFEKRGQRLPLENSALAYNYGISCDFWRSPEKNIGLKIKCSVDKVHMTFNPSQREIFTSNDLDSYNPLISRIGHSGIRSINFSVGLMFKI